MLTTIIIIIDLIKEIYFELSFNVVIEIIVSFEIDIETNVIIKI